MKKITSIVLLFPILLVAQKHEENIKKTFDETLTNSPIHENMRVLCKKIGNRLSGSPEAAAAVEYTKQLMEAYGFDEVYLQPVMVPHWVRGAQEKARVVNSNKLGSFNMTCTALGNSIGTGSGGLVGEVVEVSSIEEVNNLGNQVEGKIVFYNGSMDPTLINTF